MPNSVTLSAPSASVVNGVTGGPILPTAPTTPSKRLTIPPGLANMQQVMATPPTVAISTTNPLATGQQYAVVDFQAHPDLSNFAITGAGNATLSGGASPDNGLVSFNSVVANNGTIQAGSNLVRVSVIFNSPAATPAIALVLKGIGGNITAKVDGKYVSLAPTAVPANGSLNFYSLTFAAPGVHRIDFIVDNVLNSFHFGGIWAGKTDTVVPAPINGGKRILVMGDSITAATGATNQSAGWVQCFAEYMGYDDVWPAGVGGTGLLNTGAGSVTYQTRVQSDIIAFNPDEVIIEGFYNDGTFTGAQVQAALLSLVKIIMAALPACRITIMAPYSPVGVGFQGGTSAPTSSAIVAHRAACSAVVATINSPLVTTIDPSTLPFPNPSPVIYNLTAPATANTGSISQNTGLTPGATYQFADGSRFKCLTTTGVSATVDNVPNNELNQATFTQCGASWLTGNGFSGAPTGVGNADVMIATDHIHPVNAGHFALALVVGAAYTAQLNTLG
jgi:hypothetical protein